MDNVEHCAMGKPEIFMDEPSENKNGTKWPLGKNKANIEALWTKLKSDRVSI